MKTRWRWACRSGVSRAARTPLSSAATKTRAVPPRRRSRHLRGRANYRIGRYPDNIGALEDTIAKMYGAKAENVLISTGSGLLLEAAVKAYASGSKPSSTAHRRIRHPIGPRIRSRRRSSSCRSRSRRSCSIWGQWRTRRRARASCSCATRTIRRRRCIRSRRLPISSRKCARPRRPRPSTLTRRIWTTPLIRAAPRRSSRSNTRTSSSRGRSRRRTAWPDCGSGTHRPAGDAQEAVDRVGARQRERHHRRGGGGDAQGRRPHGRRTGREQACARLHDGRVQGDGLHRLGVEHQLRVPQHRRGRRPSSATRARNETCSSRATSHRWRRRTLASRSARWTKCGKRWMSSATCSRSAPPRRRNSGSQETDPSQTGRAPHTAPAFLFVRSDEVLAPRPLEPRRRTSTVRYLVDAEEGHESQPKATLAPSSPGFSPVTLAGCGTRPGDDGRLGRDDHRQFRRRRARRHRRVDQ